MGRLPIPGSDNGTWGGILNGFLEVEHNSDGTLKNVARPADVAVKADNSSVVHLAGSETITGSKTFALSPLLPNPALLTQAATKGYVDSMVSLNTPYVIDVLLVSGAALIGNDILPPGSRIPRALTLTELHLRAGTAPTGSSLTATITRSGATLATISLISTKTIVDLTGLSMALNQGDILTYNITAIGSVGPGSDIALQLIGS